MRYFAALIAGMLAAGAIVVIGLQIRSNTNRPTRTIVHNRTVISTPIVSSPLTPLPRDSGPKNNARKGRGQSHTASSRLQGFMPSGGAADRRAPSSGSQKKRSPVKTRPTPRPKAKPQNDSQGGSQTPPSQPPAPQPPLVGVTVPAPVSACVDRLAGVNCP